MLLQRKRLWLNFPKCGETAPVGLMSLDSLQVPTQFHSRKSISSRQRWEQELLYLQTPHFSTHFWKALPLTKSCFHRLLSTVLTEMFPVVSEGWILLFAECWSALCCIHWNFSCCYYSVYYCHSSNVSLPKAFRRRTQGWTRWVLASLNVKERSYWGKQGTAGSKTLHLTEKMSVLFFQHTTLKFKVATNIPQCKLQTYTDDTCLPAQAPDFDSPE